MSPLARKIKAQSSVAQPASGCDDEIASALLSAVAPLLKARLGLGVEDCGVEHGKTCPVAPASTLVWDFADEATEDMTARISMPDSLAGRATRICFGATAAPDPLFGAHYLRPLVDCVADWISEVATSRISAGHPVLFGGESPDTSDEDETLSVRVRMDVGSDAGERSLDVWFSQSIWRRLETHNATDVDSSPTDTPDDPSGLLGESVVSLEIVGGTLGMDIAACAKLAIGDVVALPDLDVDRVTLRGGGMGGLKSPHEAGVPSVIGSGALGVDGGRRAIWLNRVGP